MPYMKCPRCGSLSHLNVGDIAQWCREFHPEAEVGDLVEGICYICWTSLSEDEKPDLERRKPKPAT